MLKRMEAGEEMLPQPELVSEAARDEGFEAVEAGEASVEVAAMASSTKQTDDSENKQELWKNAGFFSRAETTLAHQIVMNAQAGAGAAHRGGLDFYTLARGTDRSYSCSFLVNLDPDLLSLCSREDATALDLARDALISHTKRIFKFITLKSGREVNQFCFGSTNVQLNPNYRRFDKMDPMTWKKEGIASHWTGLRGYRKSCCKVCCQDAHCSGCRNCRGCSNGPIRGAYDGLVVLCSVTRESLPNLPIVLSARKALSRKPLEETSRLPDHELFSISLETLLSTHFMYGDPDYVTKCVPSARTSILLGETVDDLRKTRKFSGYVVYVAYRLEPASAISHALKLNRITSGNAAANGPVPNNVKGKQLTDVTEHEEPVEDTRLSSASGFGYGSNANYELDEDPGYEYLDDLGLEHNLDAEDYDGDEEKLLEDLEDKQLLARIKELEAENSRLMERVGKLEHGRTWVENRLTALEAEVTALKGTSEDK